LGSSRDTGNNYESATEGCPPTVIAVSVIQLLPAAGPQNPT